MFKVMTIVGTRPEIIKLSEVIKSLDKVFEHVLVHTGQHYDYELSQVFFEDLGLRAPDIYLDVAHGQTAVQAIAQIFVAFEQVLDKHRPDAVLIYGDTNSCLCAYVAKRKQIPIFHMEAGNRCFDARVPEEVNRKIIDHLSDVNMTITEQARRNLIAEGLPENRVFKVGSSMQQILNRNALKISESKVLQNLSLTSQKYVLVSIHREENITNRAYVEKLYELLGSLITRFDVEYVIVSTHPRTRKALESYGDLDRVLMLRPFGFIDYMKLQSDAYCVISDSGTIMEESALWQFPAVTIRDSFERPEGMDAGILIVCQWNVQQILNSVDIVRTFKYENNVTDYLANDVAQKVVVIIASHINQIKNKTYFKNSQEQHSLPSPKQP